MSVCRENLHTNFEKVTTKMSEKENVNIDHWQQRNHHLIFSKSLNERLTIAMRCHLIDETACALLAFDDDVGVVDTLQQFCKNLPYDIRLMLDDENFWYDCNT